MSLVLEVDLEIEPQSSIFVLDEVLVVLLFAGQQVKRVLLKVWAPNLAFSHQSKRQNSFGMEGFHHFLVRLVSESQTDDLLGLAVTVRLNVVDLLIRAALHDKL